jgi:hypothetical protein
MTTSCINHHRLSRRRYLQKSLLKDGYQYIEDDHTESSDSENNKKSDSSRKSNYSKFGKEKKKKNVNSIEETSSTTLNDYY